MTDAKLFMDKINEIERRMDYVIGNWQSDTRITPQDQEVRFIFVASLYGLYKGQKIRDTAKTYLQKIKERERLDSEALLTCIASSLVINRNFTDYFSKLEDLINRSHGVEKYNIAMHFLIILTPRSIRKFESEDRTYIRNLLKELRQQDAEKKLFSYWMERRLFSNKGKITISPEQIKHLKEYLLWEFINSDEYDDGKEKLRDKFIPEILNYKVDRIDWITFLIYQFLKKNKIIVITERELDIKIKHKIESAISKKVWFPLIFSIVFLLVKLYSASIITMETIGQILSLILGTSLLFFEERLPPFEIPVRRYKITCGQIGELLIILSILWTLNLISLIREIFP